MSIGAKSVETRSWSTSYRGEIAIHAARHFTAAEKLVCNQEPFKSCLLRGGYHVSALAVDLPLGCVVAVAVLEIVVPTWIHGVPHGRMPARLQAIQEPERHFGNYAPDRFAWFLGNVRALAEPIPLRGEQGLFEWTPVEPLRFK